MFYSGSNHILTDNRKGIFLVIGAMTILAIQDVLIKLVSDELSLFQIQFFRSIIGMVLIVGAGIYVFYRERIKSESIVSEITTR